MPRRPEYFCQLDVLAHLSRALAGRKLPKAFLFCMVCHNLLIYIYIYSAIASLDIYRYIDLEIREILIYRSRDLYNMG